MFKNLENYIKCSREIKGRLICTTEDALMIRGRIYLGLMHFMLLNHNNIPSSLAPSHSKTHVRMRTCKQTKTLEEKKTARFWHLNPKRVWNVDLEARECESARAGKRDLSRFLAVALSLPRPRNLAFSSLAFFKTSIFQTRLRFSCENLAFLFLDKRARLEIASGPNGTP